jgi:hypothetical protein
MTTRGKPFVNAVLPPRAKINYRNSQACRDCAIRSQCTGNQFRSVSRLENEAVLDRMQARIAQRPDILDQRRETVEHPFWHDQAMDEPGCVSDARVGQVGPDVGFPELEIVNRAGLSLKDGESLPF